MNRLTAACVALLAVAVTGLFAPGRADAAPLAGPIPPGMCSIPEWQAPSNWVSCAGKLQGGLAQMATCAQAPTPDDPTGGLAGWVSERTDADLRPGVTDRAMQYGVAGYQLDTYGQGCSSTLTRPVSNGETELASGEFQVAAAIVGGADNLREHAYRPGGVWGFTDGLLGTVVDATFRLVFTPWSVVTLLLTGLYLIWRQRGGNLSESAKVAGWALLVTVAMVGVFRYPLWSAHAADTVAATGIDAVHSAVGQGPQDVPAKDCVSPDPQACKDHRTPAGRASATLVDNLLYRNWLRAELGSADSDTAKMYGPALYDAQALTWDESRAAQDPKVRAQIAADKAARFNTIAAQIKQDDPLAYEHLQGGHGMSRIFAGAVSVLSAVFVCAFDLAASLVILFGFLLVRLVVMAAPVLATIGVFRPWSGPLRAAVDAFFSAIYYSVAAAALSGLYLAFAALALSSSMPAFVQVAAVALAGFACWKLASPLRRYRDLARLRPTRRSRRTAEAGPAGGRHAAEVVPA